MCLDSAPGHPFLSARCYPEFKLCGQCGIVEGLD